MADIEPLSLTTHTLYAELLEQSVMAAFDRDFPANGSFVRKRIKGKTYWYFNQHVEAEGTKTKYVGRDTPELAERIRKHQDEKKIYRDRRQMVVTLRRLGLPGPTPLVGDLLEAMADAGVFRLRSCLIGTAAYQVYPAMLGVKFGGTAAMTEDLDLSQFLSISMEIKDETPPLLEILQQVDKTFRAVPDMAEGHRTRAYRNRSGFRVELLVPNRGSDDYEGRPVALPALGHTDATPIRFLDYLIYQEAQAVVLHKAGILVNVPQPARYAVHKLIVSARRGAGNPKVRKDIEQAGTLFRALEETRHSYEVKEAWDEAIKRGESWREALEEGRSMLTDEASKVLDSLLAMTATEEREQRRLAAEYSEILSQLMAEETEISKACENGAAYQVHVSDAKRLALTKLLDKAESRFSKLGLDESRHQIPAIRDYLAAPVEQITVYHRLRALTQTVRDEWNRRQRLRQVSPDAGDE